MFSCYVILVSHFLVYVLCSCGPNLEAVTNLLHIWVQAETTMWTWFQRYLRHTVVYLFKWNLYFLIFWINSFRFHLIYEKESANSWNLFLLLFLYSELWKKVLKCEQYVFAFISDIRWYGSDFYYICFACVSICSLWWPMELLYVYWYTQMSPSIWCLKLLMGAMSSTKGR